ncbi:MAG: nucleotidyl transferase AbiEii/AbiGii toxin family protein [Bacteroidales bacterium]|nr:nucleotidyl transferase AbiEii/AbiGii toxin family protein [Bacteroidales bacterium]
MIKIETIRNFAPSVIRDNPVFYKYLLKEYIQLMILDYLSNTAYTRKITFIGGTNLRLIKGIDRFSEDLDFDCKEFTQEEFTAMTDKILQFLNRNGLKSEIRDKDTARVKAFRSNFHFPGLLFELGLTMHREERMLIKIESQDQLVHYKPVIVNIKGYNFFFPFPVPPDDVLCAMKVAAMLNRQKGRDFYDAMFLLGQAGPAYGFLSIRCGVNDLAALKQATAKMLNTTDLKAKMKDFEHLLFNKENSKRILRIGEFISGLREM